MKRNYIQPETQVTKAHLTGVLMASGGVRVAGRVGSIKTNTPLYWATAGAGPDADACSGV